MTQYRDDLEAAHARIRSLELEVEQLRGPEPDDSSQRSGEAMARATSGRGGGLLVVAGVVVLAGLLLVALVTRRPAVFVLIPPMLAMFVAMILVGRLVHVVRPGELLVLAGRTRRLPDGAVVGFRTIAGGRAVALPFLEQVYHMDLRAQQLELKVQDVHTRDGVPAEVRGHLIFAMDPDRPEAAVERFMEAGTDAMNGAAREVVEGALRATLADESLESFRANPTRVRERCEEEVTGELGKLGLSVIDLGLLGVYEARRSAP